MQDPQDTKNENIKVNIMHYIYLYIKVECNNRINYSNT